MRKRLILLSVSVALLAAWAGKFAPMWSWPDGH